MSPAHVLQPTYERLKREIMKGVWAQNVRLEPARIGEDYGVSASPVRDSLNLLVGEGLIAFRPGEGYRTRVVTERDVSELLALNLMLLQWAVDGSLTTDGAEDQLGSELRDDYAGSVGMVFRDIGLSSGNRALGSFVERINDRLHQLADKGAPHFLGPGPGIARLARCKTRRARVGKCQPQGLPPAQDRSGPEACGDIAVTSFMQCPSSYYHGAGHLEAPRHQCACTRVVALESFARRDDTRVRCLQQT
ncbi:MAG: GntR family transcriptional regulator [Erythrobacter sp.]